MLIAELYAYHQLAVCGKCFFKGKIKLAVGIYTDRIGVSHYACKKHLKKGCELEQCQPALFDYPGYFEPSMLRKDQQEAWKYSIVLKNKNREKEL